MGGSEARSGGIGGGSKLGCRIEARDLESVCPRAVVSRATERREVGMEGVCDGGEEQTARRQVLICGPGRGCREARRGRGGGWVGGAVVRKGATALEGRAS